MSAQELKLNVTLPGEIIEGVEQLYEINLEAGYYAGIEIQQRSLAVSATVTNPAGQSQDTVLGIPPRIPFGVGILATQTGTYKINVSPQTAGASGEFGIRLFEIIPAAERLRPTGDPRYRSPRLDQLFASGKLDEFWAEVNERGTPLVESYDVDPNYCLVTFLYQGSPATSGVLVRWYPHVRADYSNCLMQRWADSNLWYRTFLVPAAARFTYDLVENPGPPWLFLSPQSSRPIDEARWSTIARTVKDVFNKFPVDGLYGVELPAAPAQPYQLEQVGIPKGKLEPLDFVSQCLKNQRKLQIYTPPGYDADSGKLYPLLIVMDGPRYTSSIPTPRLLDNLLHAGKIAPPVAVFVPNISTEMRYRELGCNPCFTAALADELIPLVGKQYRVSTASKDTTLAGSSRAGLMAVCAAIHRSEVFGNVIAQSPLLWYDHSMDYFVDDLNRYKRDPLVQPNWAAKAIIESPRLPIRFYLDAGVFEANTSHPGNGAILESTRHFRDVLRAKGYDVHYQEFVGGHEYFNWRGTFADAILAMFGVAGG